MFAEKRDARARRCARASQQEGALVVCLPDRPPPERRGGSRRSGSGKKARAGLHANANLALAARSAVDGRTGWGMGPPGPRERSRNICETTGLGAPRCSFYVLISFAPEVKPKNRTNSDQMFLSQFRRPLPEAVRGEAAQDLDARKPGTLRNKILQITPCAPVPLAGVSLMLCRKKMGLLYTLHSP
jgi:hypothetical protein